MTILNLIKEWANFFLLMAAFLTIVVKPIRNSFINFISCFDREGKLVKSIEELKCNSKKTHAAIEEIKNDLIESKEIDKLTLSNSIVRLYHQYLNEPALPAYEREILIKLYEKYRELGGNSFVLECYEELKNKPIKKEEV